MKAIIRWGVGLLGLLLMSSVSHAYVWVSPVFKCPLPCAPDCYGPGFWAQGPHGMWYGPNYYLMPPCGPFNGMLPGPTGKALMTGGLPMMDGSKIAPPNAGDLQKLQGPQPPQAPQLPQQPLGYGSAPPSYQMPYPRPMPYSQPYPQAMPYPQPMPVNRPAGYMAYQGPAGVSYVPVWQDPATGIWLVQNAAPNQGGAIRPIPNFNAPMPMPAGPGPGQQPVRGYVPMPMQPGGMPQTPPMPGYVPMPTPPGQAPMTPGISYGPSQGFQYYLNSGEGGDKMTPMQPMQPLQLPRMDPMAGPPPARVGGPFPTHPFMRSPRDFFMWGEMMDAERARGSRPNPVP